jgi:hypothetical protein
MQLFEEFDFNLLDKKDFKEDSVREEIIVPILAKLGYSATSNNRIIRSKTLEHPYVQFGVKSHGISIIPDYLIEIDGKYKFVLDAKAPNEIVTTGKNAAQVYSYATHREIRVNLYGLCNGRELVVFDANETKPKLHVPIEKINERWREVYNLISPLALTKPYILTFKPDFGFHLIRLGFETNTDYTFLGVWSNFIAKISDTTYTFTTYMEFDEKSYCGSFDFDIKLLSSFLEAIPSEKRDKIKTALSHYPFKIGFEKKEEAVNVGIIATLSDKVEFGKSEAFVPFFVKSFMAKE